MKKIVLVYGAIAGVVVIIALVAGLTLSEGEGPWSSQWLGYLVMFVALSLIFVGVKRYRDTELGGVIGFGRAFQVGLGIAQVASVAYVLSWEAYLATTDYAFIDDYTVGVIESKRAEGLSEDAMQELITEMENMKAMYGKPWLRLPITFLEIFPVGLLVALVSAGLLKNPQLMPSQNQN